MNKTLIQELLNDDETRRAIAATLGIEDGPMRWTLNKLNDEPAKGEVIIIEVSPDMWVRGKYVRTEPSGEMVVEVPENRSDEPFARYYQKYYQGKRVDLVIKAKEGEADV